MKHERHGEFGTPEYWCWAKIIQRCNNPKAVGYKYWGGRGIAICRRWRESFSAFLSDMGRRPSVNHSIDRIDNDGDYEPGNCRWADRFVQNSNMRRTKTFHWRGRAMTLREWSTVLGVSYATLAMRISRGWTIDHTFSEGASRKRPKAKGDKRYTPKAFRNSHDG